MTELKAGDQVVRKSFPYKGIGVVVTITSDPRFSSVMNCLVKWGNNSFTELEAADNLETDNDDYIDERTD